MHPYDFLTGNGTTTIGHRFDNSLKDKESTYSLGKEEVLLKDYAKWNKAWRKGCEKFIREQKKAEKSKDKNSALEKQDVPQQRAHQQTDLSQYGPDISDNKIWGGKVDRYYISWTLQDISAASLSHSSDVIFSAIARSWNHLSVSLGTIKEWPFNTYQNTYELLSVVGPFVSLKETEYYANPGAYTVEDVIVINLSLPRRMVKLTDIFPDKEVLNALLNDPVVEKTLKEIGKPKRPFKSTAALLKHLNVNRSRGVTGQYYFDDNLLNGFAFHHIEREKIAVRLAVYFHEAMRFETFQQLGLLLPIPPLLKEHIKLAGAV